MRLPPECRSHAKYAAPQATARSSDGLVSTAVATLAFVEPRPHHIDDALAQHLRLEHAAVEEDRIDRSSDAAGCRLEVVHVLRRTNARQVLA